MYRQQGALMSVITQFIWPYMDGYTDNRMIFLAHFYFLKIREVS
jgi:hypothetical protein